jgi:hypothetical protein
MREVTIRQLMQAIELSTGTTHQLRVIFPKLAVRLPIDPSKASSLDDRFILTIDNNGAKSQIVQTVRDDHIPGDAYVDLVFTRLWPDARYTLTVDPGAEGKPYNVFEDRPQAELFEA